MMIPFPCKINESTNTVEVTVNHILGVDMVNLTRNLLMTAIKTFPSHYVCINHKLPNGFTIALYANSIFKKEIK